MSSLRALDRLEPAWTRLHEESGAGVFQSFAWQRTWWRHFGEPVSGRRLRVLVVEADGSPVAIAPFFREEVRIAPGLALRRLAFVGTGVTDHLDVVVRPGFEVAACDRLADHLARRPEECEVLSLVDVPDDSRTRVPLFEALVRHGFDGTSFVVECCPRVRLAATWDETLAAFRGNQRRGQLLRRIRQLRHRFGMELELCEDPSTIEEDVDEFVSMHQERWTARGRKGALADHVTAAFLREVARALFERNRLFLAFLRLEVGRVAAVCAFRYQNELSFYLSGLRDAGPASRQAPGLVLHALCMERFVAEGGAVYDFLRGREPYKYEFGAVDRANWALHFHRRGAWLPKAKRRIAALEEALLRRVEAERLAFDHARRLHGLSPVQMARYVRGRLGTTVRHGIEKLRDPEKPLASR